MSKYIWSIAVVGLIVLTASQEASAGRRHWRRRRSVWYAQPAVMAPAPSYSAPAAVAPQTGATQVPNSGYRSYSYDPTPVYQAPAAPAYRQLPPSERRFYRADRKAHGLSWYENQW